MLILLVSDPCTSQRIGYTPSAMSKRTTTLRCGRRFRAERRALCGKASVRGDALSATDASLCWWEAVGRFASRESMGFFSRTLDAGTCMVASPTPTPTPSPTPTPTQTATPTPTPPPCVFNDLGSTSSGSSKSASGIANYKWFRRLR